MQLSAKLVEFEAKKPIVILNKKDADELGVKASDRVDVISRKKSTVAIVNVAEKFVKPGEVGIYPHIIKEFKLKGGEKMRIFPALDPDSLLYVRKKLEGRVLKETEIREIVKDVVNHRLSEIEIASLLTALHERGMSMSEVAAMSRSMAETGKRPNISKNDVFDKHSIGGVPGDKTSILLVPTVAAAGLTIPKTSSRAITSPAGTADRFECIAPVELGIEDIKRVVKKTGGCLVWGGAVELAPADDIFIQIEYPLSIDPMLLPSVMSKKMAVGAKYLVIDIPTGRGTKVKTIGEANELAHNFIDLGRRLGIKVSCVSTFGEQPIGYNLGPALEAREALGTLLTGRGPQDLIDKVSTIAGTLFKMKGMRSPEQKARELIRSGKAGKKLKEIIKAQGGNPNIKPEDIPLGSHRFKVKAACSGKIWWMSNHALVHICREAGTPNFKGAGIRLNKKIGDTVKKGDTLFEIYAEKSFKLNRALKTAAKHEIVGVGDRYDVVLARIPEEEHKKHFILER